MQDRLRTTMAAEFADPRVWACHLSQKQNLPR
jgi:hypothetical protein